MSAVWAVKVFQTQALGGPLAGGAFFVAAGKTWRVAALWHLNGGHFLLGSRLRIL